MLVWNMRHVHTVEAKCQWVGKFSYCRHHKNGGLAIFSQERTVVLVYCHMVRCCSPVISCFLCLNGSGYTFFWLFTYIVYHYHVFFFTFSSTVNTKMILKSVSVLFFFAFLGGCCFVLFEPVWPCSLVWNLWSSCLSLLSAKVIGTYLAIFCFLSEK